MEHQLHASDDGQDAGRGVRVALSAADELHGCALRAKYRPLRSPRHGRHPSESDLAVGDLTLNDTTFDEESSELEHADRMTPPRSHSYRITYHKPVLSSRRDSSGCVFRLPKPLTEEQTRAGYCILTFDEPHLHSDGCKETENGICMADFVVHIPDTRAIVEKETGSLRLKTLPKYFGIGQSSHHLGKLGVFALKDLPHPSFFGPFFGRNRPLIECSMADRCCEKVLNKVYTAADIDTTQETGTWMTFIKFTNEVRRTNLTAFIHGDSIYYKTTAAIKKFDELVLNTTCDQHFTSSSILLKTMFD